MKYIFTPLILLFLFTGKSYSQTSREIHGTLIDTTKQTLPGSSVKIVTDVDSTTVMTDMNGKFSFSNIKGNKFTLYLSSFGYKGIKKHFSFLPTDTARVLNIAPIMLKSDSKQLNEVVIVGVNPVKFAEDTVDYKIAAYPVRENAPVEDVLKKLPGVDVDVNGNVTTQGKTITKIRINGKDYMGGDVQAATKNLPADILESVQIIDDYGDQANLTGVKTGEPNKILNFTIRADKNYGYSLQATAGDGEDYLPKAPGVNNSNRYIGSVNAFNFKGDRQITILGNINNTNTNTFNFGGGNNGGGGGGNGGGGRGGQRGGNGLASTKDGITNAHAIGTNYRDQWGKYTSVYGSYSFSDNSTLTTTTSLTTNSGAGTASNSDKQSKDNPVNHRFNFNIEYKPDTINYLKITPTFTYAGTNSSSLDNELYTVGGVVVKKYSTVDVNHSSSPSFGVNVLYNHRFPNRRNLSIYLNGLTTQTNSYDNPVNTYTVGVSNVPANQVINTNNLTTTVGGNLSYLEPIGKISYLEFNYTFSHSYTSNDKETDTLSAGNTFNNYALLSNNYNFTFTTNKAGLNYRVIAAKYNYTLGMGVQPSVLDGQSMTTGLHTHITQFNYIPAARYIYNFSRNESFSANYNGSSSQPTFSQLQPVTDFSNALYLIQGNPDLKPQFTNNFSMRYQSFGIASGNVFFANAMYSSINNYVASNQITYPSFTKGVLSANPGLSRYQNTILTKYLNTDGYYSATLQGFISKPWEERKYTVSFGASGSYAVAPAFATNVDSNNVSGPMLKNIAKTLTLSPNARFRVDIINVIDVQAITTYSIAKTDNSLSGGVFNQNTNIRGLSFALNGKNYFGNWTFDYEYSKQYNYGYASSLNVTNPNILNVYLERRFLKQNRATVRLATIDLFNQNTGFSTTSTGSSVVQTNTNRLGRYYMLTFSLRLQKFAGRAPTQQNGNGRDGGGRGNRGFGGGGGGNGGGGNGGNGGGE
ncbi:outer membrane beta-barrel protein [Mucilaginibacter sp.]|uniref:outer membrane beta-barrel protein n=1 Tax=Mucilaginibacter sp. TaxID=1882438 RepID=UPI00262EA81F|nr:outer membrane beta-barrel protein [Mucilaginibacter sp.]MDB5031656.1 hypothetical protein [Mucilaginibacter sp.]